MSDEFSAPYRGYDVLGKWDTPSFNDQTRQVLRDRMTPPPRRFFTQAEWRVLEALCARVIPQPEREEPVAIAPFIDTDLYHNRGTGTRRADMPPPAAAWRQGLAALDAEAQARHGCGFADLDGPAADAILKAVDDGDLTDKAAWDGLPAQRFLRDTVLKTIVSIYYSQPQGMSEIGYGGPASPRGYVRLGADRIDRWEAPYGNWPDSPQET
ncbi:gluconate 2-dehydrogenase subunit 3 family protein [Brevirhabdus sp.]|uniref:gluconate 2-dehydrogenase subunit 3 family protein n=1 Tax=Brevirhabdus sp. TaxID=2004514 RepID=UPI004057FE56